jgi:uncharacterized protein
MKHPLSGSILISGGSGLIGTSLVRFFSVRRIPMLRLVRGSANTPTEVPWSPDACEPVANPSPLEETAAAIHLSGANLSAHRWTEAYKQKVVDSRIATTRALVNLLKKLAKPPRSLLCASAVGIYGDRGDEVLTESSPPGQGFLADTCRAWEAEADRAAEVGIRVIHLRFGVVLSREGGPLRQMLPVFQAGLGGPLGTGRQWMSWIAADDLVRAVLHILDVDSLIGSVNLVSPIPVTNTDFTRALGRRLRRPTALRVPRFALRAALGEVADAAVLASTRAIPERLAASGFHFDFPEINDALRSIL